MLSPKKEKFRKISRAIIAEMADQIMKLLQNAGMVDLYYKLEQRLTEAQESAYNDGYTKGRQEVLESIQEFDDSKDPVQN